jgi:demethylmenaquinone methyltransferase / 2-methoxy-6-polyprenyl-1,4-benzoquinol methylase
MTNTTHFGFKQVDADEKASLVRGVFDSVASRYDLMNDLMSAGLHRLWKREMVNWLNPQAGMKILDVAGGTGDIAFRILDSIKPPPQPSPLQGERVKITILDINQQMLSEGHNRAIDQNRLSHIEWLCADAEKLPLPDNHFDAYTIAFGIRNVTHIENALAEAYRVLKPGGRFMCMEFSHLPNETMQKIYDTYSFNVIPFVGEKVTGDRAAYQYLVESIRQFPAQEKFVEMIRAAGFGNVQYRNLTHGVVAMHSGRKL